MNFKLKIDVIFTKNSLTNHKQMILLFIKVQHIVFLLKTYFFIRTANVYA